MNVLLVGTGTVGEAIAHLVKGRKWLGKMTLADYSLDRARTVADAVGAGYDVAQGKLVPVFYWLVEMLQFPVEVRVLEVRLQREGQTTVRPESWQAPKQLGAIARPKKARSLKRHAR